MRVHVRVHRGLDKDEEEDVSMREGPAGPWPGSAGGPPPVAQRGNGPCADALACPHSVPTASGVGATIAVSAFK